MSDYPMLISNKLHSFRNFSIATYNKARKGKPKVLTLQKGGFGLPVITKGL